MAQSNATIKINLNDGDSEVAGTIWDMFDKMIDNMSAEAAREALKIEARLRYKALQDDPGQVTLSDTEAAGLYEYVQGDCFYADDIDSAMRKLEPAYQRKLDAYGDD